jgi:hypothetical protein
MNEELDQNEKNVTWELVRGLSRIVHPFRVAINTKGGDCWNVL